MQEDSALGVGIDVSKDTLSIALKYRDKDEHILVPNTPNGIKAINNKLKTYLGNIVMESTGRYHIMAAFLLAEKGYKVHVVNPLDAKRYTTAKTRKKKTDQSDAQALAHMAMMEKELPPAFTARKTDIEARQKIGLLCTLEKKSHAFRAVIREYREFQNKMDIPSSQSEDDLEKIISALEKQKYVLEEEIEHIVMYDGRHQKFVETATSIPGVSTLLACLLAQSLDIRCTHAKQWIHFLGLDVPPRESGRWRGKSKLSKRGNAYLRKRLFNAAWGAKQNNQHFQAYYQRLRNEGRSYKEAMIIICRKLLRILFTLVKNNGSFSISQCEFS